MRRPLRTLLLSASAIAAVTTAATAAPATPTPVDAATYDRASVPAISRTHMHGRTGGMTAMHRDAMQADCTVRTDGSMGTMDRHGGNHDAHTTLGGERR